MLDSDVVMLYHYTTENINKAMKSSVERFPEYFCFQLTDEEVSNLRFHFGTSSLEKEKFKEKVFFEGQIYDAYSLLIDIIKTAKSKILIIDNYIDDAILSMLSKKSKINTKEKIKFWYARDLPLYKNFKKLNIYCFKFLYVMIK